MDNAGLLRSFPIVSCLVVPECMTGKEVPKSAGHCLQLRPFEMRLADIRGR